MHQKLFELLGLDIYSYGFMLMVGFILALYVTSRRAKAVGIKPEFITDLAIWAIVCGVIGARVAYILEVAYSPENSPQAAQDFKGGGRVFDIFDGNLSWLGALVGLGVAVAVILLYKYASREGLKLKKENGSLNVVALVVVAICALVLVVGTSRAWQLAFTETGEEVAVTVVTEDGKVEPTGEMRPKILHEDYNLSYFALRSGGLTFYGGMVPTAIVILLITWRRKYKVWQVADVVAPALMLGLAFGRIGCFLNGCCWGLVKEDGFWSHFTVSFPKGCEAYRYAVDSAHSGHSMPLVATQPISSLAVFGLFLFLSWFFWKKHRNGEVFVLMCGLYSLFRFLIEFLRGDNARELGGMTFSQLISIGVAAVALVIFLLLRYYKRGSVGAKRGDE